MKHMCWVWNIVPQTTVKEKSRGNLHLHQLPRRSKCRWRRKQAPASVFWATAELCDTKRRNSWWTLCFGIQYFPEGVWIKKCEHTNIHLSCNHSLEALRTCQWMSMVTSCSPCWVLCFLTSFCIPNLVLRTAQRTSICRLFKFMLLKHFSVKFLESRYYISFFIITYSPKISILHWFRWREERNWPSYFHSTLF